MLFQKKEVVSSDHTTLMMSLIVIIMSILTGILQTCFYTETDLKILRALSYLILSGALFLIIWYVTRASRTTDEGVGSSGQSCRKDLLPILVVFTGMLLRSFYCLFSDIYMLQNDGGVYTGFGTDQINPGHLGYIEYLYKFHHMPTFDPYELIGYYHPPLHHTIAALWLTLQRALGLPEYAAFENLQVLTLLYSGLCMPVLYRILKKAGVSQKLMPLGLAIVCLHPRMSILAGSINNDMLALLLLFVVIDRTLCWIQKRTLPNILLIALFLGLGMLSKLNVAITAFSLAVLFLWELIHVLRGRNLLELKSIMLQYVLFALLVIPLGFAYVARNLILFGEKPGIPSPALVPEQSVLFTGPYSVWSIIGIPANWHIDWPFHPLSAEAVHNTWVILFQTALWGEVWPTSISDFMLALSQVAYAASIIAGIGLAIAFLVIYVLRFVREFRELKAVPGAPDDLRTKAQTTGFLAITNIFMLMSFSLFVFKYPYTCSSDFRYMVTTLIFAGLGLVSLKEAAEGGSGTGAVYASGNTSPVASGASGVGQRVMKLVYGILLFSTFLALLCAGLVWLSGELFIKVQ